MNYEKIVKELFDKNIEYHGLEQEESRLNEEKLIKDIVKLIKSLAK